MTKTESKRRLAARSQRWPVLVILPMLGVLAAVIVFTARSVRHTARDLMIGRDGEKLYAVARVQADRLAEELEELNSIAGTAEFGAVGDLNNLRTILLETAGLAEAVGVRLYDASGRYLESFPPDILEQPLALAQWKQVQERRPANRFLADMALTNVFHAGALEPKTWAQHDPILEVSIPLHTSRDTTLLGAAQFLIQGQTVAQDFASLDRHLASVSLGIFLAGGLALSLAIGWSWGRLGRINALLTQRTETLAKANQELSLAAKSSAVGALASHLIHGLKNPLSGLQQFVSRLDSGSAEIPGADNDWHQAVNSTRRMQTLIHDVVSVLQEEQNGLYYEVTYSELVDLLRAKVEGKARDKGVQLSMRADVEGVMTNRTANLVMMILVNLLDNAVQATPSGRGVRLAVGRAANPGGIRWTVADEGSGLSAEVRQNLFVPCASNREGGSGIGLAISRQLAAHLGADLSLESTSREGSRFTLTVPESSESA